MYIDKHISKIYNTTHIIIKYVKNCLQGCGKMRRHGLLPHTKMRRHAIQNEASRDASPYKNEASRDASP